MNIPPAPPTEPEPSWQRPRRQVTFSERIEFYDENGEGSTSRAKHDDTAIELGLFSKDRPSAARLEETGKREVSRRTICCLSRKTFFVLVIIAVFLFGGLLGGVAATQINKTKSDTRYVDLSKLADTCSYIEVRLTK